MFLEAEGSLDKNFSWQQLQPVRGSLLEGIGRLPRQLIGAMFFFLSSRLYSSSIWTLKVRLLLLSRLPPCRVRQQRAHHGRGTAECSQHQRPAAAFPGAGGAHAAGVQGAASAAGSGGQTAGE